MPLEWLLQLNRFSRCTALWMGLTAVTLLFALPLIGVWVAGYPLGEYLTFPPSTTAGEHYGFSWSIFVLVGFAALLLFGALVALLINAKIRYKEISHVGGFRSFRRERVPLFGWLGGILLIACWIIAWTRFDFLSLVQQHTFFPLWLSFIVVINAICEYRMAWSPMLKLPRWFLTLFLVSALFWWAFEYLNSFTKNWLYIGVDPSQPITYFISATLPFSTVLPAVLSVCALLLSFEWLNTGLQQGPRIICPYPKTVASVVLCTACVTLLLLGVFPDFLFPALWLSPLAIVVSLQTLTDNPNLFTPLRRKDWRGIAVPAIAALLCGFLWELWNIRSLAHWEYSLPFVERFKIFAMPVEGFAGYLPFGLECLVIGQLVYQSVYSPSECQENAFDEPPHTQYKG